MNVTQSERKSKEESLDGPEPWASGKITDRASLEAVLPMPVDI